MPDGGWAEAPRPPLTVVLTEAQVGALTAEGIRATEYRPLLARLVVSVVLGVLLAMTWSPLVGVLAAVVLIALAAGLFVLRRRTIEGSITPGSARTTGYDRQGSLRRRGHPARRARAGLRGPRRTAAGRRCRHPATRPPRGPGGAARRARHPGRRDGADHHGPGSRLTAPAPAAVGTLAPCSPATAPRACSSARSRPSRSCTWWPSSPVETPLAGRDPGAAHAAPGRRAVVRDHGTPGAAGDPDAGRAGPVLAR